MREGNELQIPENESVQESELWFLFFFLLVRFRPIRPVLRLLKADLNGRRKVIYSKHTVYDVT
jgi:hypothetical protein